MTESQPEFPFIANSDTSEAAARNLGRRKAEDDRAMILAFIKGRGAIGATDREIQNFLSMSGDTQRPRRNELAGNGIISKRNPIWPKLIVKSGRKRDGGAVWIAVREGE